MWTHGERLGARMLATPWVEHTMANFAGYLRSLERALAGESYRLGSLEL